MSKILGSWSAMRKYLEQEMLTDSLKGRIRYNCTSYVGMDGCHIFEMFIDGNLFKRFSWETLNTYFIENGYKENSEPFGVHEYWDGFQSLRKSVPISERTEYTDDEFCGALGFYRNNDIAASLGSGDPIVRMFAILDRRVGKRSLEKLKDTLSVQPEWLRKIYLLRLYKNGIILQ